MLKCVLSVYQFLHISLACKDQKECLRLLQESKPPLPSTDPERHMGTETTPPWSLDAQQERITAGYSPKLRHLLEYASPDPTTQQPTCRVLLSQVPCVFISYKNFAYNVMQQRSYSYQNLKMKPWSKLCVKRFSRDLTTHQHNLKFMQATTPFDSSMMAVRKLKKKINIGHYKGNLACKTSIQTVCRKLLIGLKWRFTSQLAAVVLANARLCDSTMPDTQRFSC